MKQTGGHPKWLRSVCFFPFSLYPSSSIPAGVPKRSHDWNFINIYSPECRGVGTLAFCLGKFQTHINTNDSELPVQDSHPWQVPASCYSDLDLLRLYSYDSFKAKGKLTVIQFSQVNAYVYVYMHVHTPTLTPVCWDCLCAESTEHTEWA